MPIRAASRAVTVWTGRQDLLWANIFVSDNGQASTRASKVSCLNEASCVVEWLALTSEPRMTSAGREDIVMAVPVLIHGDIALCRLGFL